MVTAAPAPEPAGRIVVDPPPALEADEGATGVLTSAVPMIGSLGSVALVATMATQSGQPGGMGHRSLLAAGTFLLGTVAFVLVQLDRQRVRRIRRRDAARRGYLRHLADVRARLRLAADHQRTALTRDHPAPATLPRIVAGGPRWERDGEHAEALRIRYAVGDRPAAVTAEPTESPPGDDPDPASLDALQRLLAVSATVPDLPLTLDLAGTPRVVVDGDAEAVRALARSVVLQAAVSHPPGRLGVAPVVDAATAPLWDWLKWLPHTHAPPPPGAHRLLVVDGSPGERPPVAPGTTVLDLAPPADHTDPDCRIVLGPGGRATLWRGRDAIETGRADRCDPATAQAAARRMLPPARDVARATTTAVPDVLDLLDLAGDGTADPDRAWAGGPRPLRVTLGVTLDGAPLDLDLEEPARGGAGPHGLVVGATGSGKSELLRTLVLGLSVSHPPDRLNLVLVDFKGGATFAGLAPLRHVAASVTNLADDLTLVDRMQDALAGELLHRQELLRDAGVVSVHEHDRARRAGADLTPLPRLLVVVDEFAEMLAARPEFLDVFTAVGRLGRSLGVHLLLASQRLDEGRLRGLESHLSYRIGLRTFSAAESRAVLGVPDAACLPPVPGSGYLRTGPEAPTRFRAAYVSGTPGARATQAPPVVVTFTREGQQSPAVPAPVTVTDQSGPSVLERAVASLAGRGRPARRVWLPPLDEADTLGALLGPLVTDPELGLVAVDRRSDPLRLPLGSVDRPREQRREPLLVDLAGSGGHVAVVGAPRSGRTTVLQSLVLALALTHTPREAQVLVLDLAGGGLAVLSELPHVAALATRNEPDVVRRVVAHASELLDRREAWFRDHRVPDVSAYRRLLRAGRTGDGHGEVFLVVDGWADLRADHDDLEPALQRLASRGLTLGVHLVLTASRWGDLRAGTRDLVGTRLELRLGDPLDSEVDRRAARAVPVGRPGRGLAPTGHHLLTALPRADDDPDPATAPAGLADLTRRIVVACPGPRAPRVGRLPTHVDLAQVRALAADADCLLLGCDDRRAVGLDPAAEPHLLVLGDRRSGRTTALRTLAAEVVRTRTPAQAQLVLLDPRRHLRDDVPGAHLLAHHVSPATAGPALRELADHLRGRLPGPDVTAAELRSRSWWSGAEVHLLVDDHELLAHDGPSPLAPLLPLLAHADEIGLRLVLARRTAGATRALHEPDLRALRDLAAPTLLLPGSPEEGPLVGRLTARRGPPGRARLVTAGGEVTELQVAQAVPPG